MKRIILLSLFILSLSIYAHGQVATQNARRLSSGTAVPTGACTPGPPYTQIYIRTTDHSEYQCTAANTWTKVTSGTPGSISGLTTNTVPKAASSTTLSDSPIVISGSNVLPSVDATSNLGSNSFRWQALFLSANADVSLTSKIRFGGPLGNFFEYVDATGPKFTDENNGNSLTFNLQSLASSRTVIWPDAAGTVMLASSALTSGRVPFVTTGGVLTDSANLTWTSPTLMLAGASLSGPDVEVKITGDTQSRVAVGINTSDTARIGFGPGSGNRDAFIEYVGAGAIKLGGIAVDTAPVAQNLSMQNVLAGGTSNVAGADFTLKGSQGKGTGIGGSLIFQVAPAGSTGTAVNALATALTIDSTKLATFNGGITLNAAPLTIMGNISGSGIFSTSGIRIKGTPGTLTDTTSSGTVATSYTDVLGGNTIAASSPTTITNWFSMYVNAAVAGTNVTLPNKWAIGADSLKVGTSNQLTVTAAGALGVNAAQTNTVSSATAFEIGANGGTNPVLRLITNVASQADGISISGGAAGAGTTIQALTSGTNTGIALKGAGTGGVTINGGQTTSGTADLTINPAVKASGNLIDAQVNSVSKFKVDFSGVGTFASSITALNGGSLNNVRIGTSPAGNSGIGGGNSSNVLDLGNTSTSPLAFSFGGSAPSLVAWGGTTSSFPAIARSATNFVVELADGTFGANLKIGATAVRGTTPSTNSLDIYDGTAPVGTLANGITLYSTAGELRVMDSGGTATLLSSHSRITGEWIHDSYSAIQKKRLIVQAEEMSKFIDAKFGTHFVSEVYDDPELNKPSVNMTVVPVPDRIGGTQTLTPTPGATITLTIDPTAKHVVASWTSGEIETINISGTPQDGTMLTMVILNDGTLGRVLTAGTGLSGLGVVTGIISKRSTVTYVALNGVFYEVSRSVGM